MTLSPRRPNGIADFQRGCYKAVKELYNEHYALLFDFASQLIINKEEAHHIVQEAFIKLFLIRDRFNKEPDIKAFLYITVRNICTAYIRAEKENEPGGDAAWYQQAQIAAVQFEEEPLRQEVLSKMHQQVITLPAPEQLVFRLLFFDGLTLPEAAERSGLSLAVVSKHRISAIRLLREKLIAAELFSIPLFIYFVAVFCGR